MKGNIAQAKQVFLAKNTTFLNENFPFVETICTYNFQVKSCQNYVNLKVRQSATEKVDQTDQTYFQIHCGAIKSKSIEVMTVGVTHC